MSVILLSDRSALGASDEHCALDVTSGRRITPVELQVIPPKLPEEPPQDSPREKPQSQTAGAITPARETAPEAVREVPASGYLPSSG